MPERREPFRPDVEVGARPETDAGFTSRNTSGLNARELGALNGALQRLMARGLSEYEAKSALHAAVTDWLEPKDAGDADVERLISWR